MIDKEHRVFGYDGLYVIDGSAVSANPGVNPSLTITALTCRAAAERGRTLFVAVVLLPWALADVLGVPQLSLPGALSALLAELTDMLSLWVAP